MINHRKLLVLLFIVLSTFIAFSQTQQSEFNLDQILVVGDRSNVKLKESTIPSGVLTKAELVTLPIKNLTDAIAYLPGITFASLDASGHTPIPIIRGYYGGGEAEYLLLLIDGVPVNDFNNGIADWNILPINHVEKIELIRGGGSSTYGGLAIGGVINVITKRNIQKNNFNISFSNDQYNQNSISLKANLQKELKNIGFSMSREKADGYRDNSNYKKNTFCASHNVLINPKNTLTLNARYDDLYLETAGALTENLVKNNHRQSHPMYSNDYKDYNKFDGTIQYSRGNKNKLTILSGFRALKQEENRTIQLTSDFGDSQSEKQTSTVFWNQAKYQASFNNTKMLIGLDNEYGSFSNNYYNLEKTQKLSNGSGASNKLGLYIQAKYNRTEKFGITSVIRLDKIDNDGNINNKKESIRFNSQISPRVGFYYQFINSKILEGYLFSNWSKAFKSPTLDQLFDSRQINFFYQNINYSNSSLVPQESSNYDIGINKKLSLSNSNISGETSIVLYSMDIENEIDFDMATFKYGNISESNHKGIEASIGLFLGERIRYRHTSNFTEVKFKDGNYKDNMLKNIPKLSYTNRFTIKLSDQYSFAISQKHFGSIYLNDENTVSLPDNTIYDSNIIFNRSNYGIHLSIFNIGNTFYNGNGYMLFDAISQQNVKFLYPAQKRNIRLSIYYTI